MNQYEFEQWRTRVRKIINDINIPWDLHLLTDKIFKDDEGNGRLYLQIQFQDADNVTGEEGYTAYCRKWYLSPYMTNQEIIRTAWLAYQGAVVHEASEKFKYKGRMIYGPHIDPESLVKIANDREVRNNHQRMDTGWYGWIESGLAKVNS